MTNADVIAKQLTDRWMTVAEVLALVITAGFRMTDASTRGVLRHLVRDGRADHRFEQVDGAGRKVWQFRSLGEVDHAAALTEQAEREIAEAAEWQATPAYRHFSRATLAGRGYRGALDLLHAEALADEAHRIAASIPVDGRPAAVTELLEAAELLTDERENLDALLAARKVYDEHLARVDDRGMRMGPGHVAPATIEAAHGEALKIDGKFVVTFERIGARRYGADALALTLDRKLLGDADELARAVHSHARRYVTSRYFKVEVNVEAGLVLIEGGRFGGGTFTPVAAEPAAPAPRRHPIFDGMPMPRADRLAAAFEAFNEQADSGGPGTSRGLIAAVESASTITEAEAENVAAELLDQLGKLGLSVPVRVGVYPLARALGRALAAAGIAVQN